jgi:hypothetical protein
MNKGGRRCGEPEEDVPWMPRVADLPEGICQDILLFRLECDVKFDHGAGRWGAQTLPVGWNSIPGVLDQCFILSFEGCREVGEENGNEEGPMPVVLHD